MVTNMLFFCTINMLWLTRQNHSGTNTGSPKKEAEPFSLLEEQDDDELQQVTQLLQDLFQIELNIVGLDSHSYTEQDFRSQGEISFINDIF